MNIVKVNLKKRSYSIIIGSNVILGLGRYICELDIGNDAFVITNRFIKNKYGILLNNVLRKSGLGTKFRIIPDTEKSKSIEMASSVINDIMHYDKKRQIFILAFGGGVVGDLTGFIASIYKRGIPYIQVPTTLLAQVDSAIGGKTAIDLIQGKNLIGAFYQPRLVLSDIKILNTLSPRQLRSGLAEVTKYGVIKDAQLFNYLEKNYKDILDLKTTALDFIVTRCSFIKAKIVQLDEYEKKGLRTILNFGHTIGHAIEAAGGYKRYNHGEAIALGMLIANDISNKLGFLDDAVAKRIEDLIEISGLPCKIRGISIGDIIKAHYRDKKFIGPKNKFVLIKGIGQAIIKENIPIEIIKGVLKNRF